MGLVLVAIGLLQVAVGAILVADHDDLDFLADVDVTPEGAKAIGIILIGVGAVAVLLAAGLLRGSRLVRWLIGLHQAIQLGVSVDTLLRLDADRRVPALVSAVASLVVLWVLFGTRRSRLFFAGE